MNSTVHMSHWELVWIVPLSLVLSASINAALALAIFKLL